jgi:hypothetical protein
MGLQSRRQPPSQHRYKRSPLEVVGRGNYADWNFVGIPKLPMSFVRLTVLGYASSCGPLGEGGDTIFTLWTAI